MRVPVMTWLSAVLIGAMAAGGLVVSARAQDATPGSGDAASAIGVVDAASRQMWNANDASAPVYGLTVLQFADAEHARAAYQTITDSSRGYLGGTPETSTPDAALDRTDVPVADGGMLYYQAGASGGAGIATLFVLSGVYVHQWYTIPIPIEQTALLVDPNALRQDLITLAQAWFAQPHGGDVLAQLPGVGQLPSGYSTLTEQSGLSMLAPATATPIAETRRAAA